MFRTHMMRVLHVISAIDPRRGGPIAAMSGLAEAQQRGGCEVSVAVTWVAGESNACQPLERARVRVDMIGPATTPLRRHPELIRVLRRLIATSDIVHIHALWEEIQHQSARLSLQMGKPYVITPHGMLSPWSLRRSRLKKLLYMRWRLRRNLAGAAALHFTSAAERDGAAGLKLDVPVIVEPLGIDLAEFETLPAPGSFRRRYPQFAGRPLIVFLGRIHPGKGLELLIPALAEVQIDAALAIVGPDHSNFRHEIDSEIARRGLTDRVVFTGMLHGADRVAALADADLLALPSFHENFGLVVVEALACGVPVIISDEVNIHREVAGARVGAVVPTQVAPLAAELRRWIGDPALRAEAGARARPFVREHYDWNRIAEHWIEHYRRLISAPQRSPAA